MDPRTGEDLTKKKIYGATSQVGGWQYSKSPLLVTIRPVLLDSFANNNNHQFTANVQADSQSVGEKQSSLNNSLQRTADFTSTNFNREKDRHGRSCPTSIASSLNLGCRAGRDFPDPESVSCVYNCNFIGKEFDGESDMDFAKYDRTKLLELSMIDKIEQSTMDAEEGRLGLALIRAKEALELLNELKGLVTQEAKPPTLTQTGKTQSASASLPMTTSTRLFELSLMVNTNLAEQLQMNGCLDESMDMYVQLCKLASSDAGSGLYSNAPSSQQNDSRFLLYRFGINIGNILCQMQDYQRALKHYRLTLDRMSSTGFKNLKIKLMNNIAITLMSVAEQNGEPVAKDGLMSMKVLLADNLIQQSGEPGEKDSRMSICNSNHHKFGLNLLTCQHLLDDSTSMMETMRSFVRADICHHHYRRVFEFGTNNATKKLLANKGVELNRTELELDKRGISSNSAHVSTSEYASRFAQVSVNQIENRGSEWSTDIMQRTTSALGALEDERETSYDSGKLIGQDKKKIGQDQDEHPRASATALFGSDHNRANIQSRSQLRWTSDSTLTSRTKSEIEETRIKVLSSIECDRLEMMIRQQHKLTSRSLIVGCNLMIHLENKSTQRVSSHHTNKVSAFDFCTNLLVASETYKHLVYDLRMNNSVKMLLSGDQNQTRLALATLKDIEDKMHGSTNIGQSSSMLCTNLCLLNMLRCDYVKAIEYAQVAVSIDDSNICGLTNLANCYYLKDSSEAARTIYRRAIMLEPLCLQAAYNLSIVTRMLGFGEDDLDETARSCLKSKSLEYMTHTKTGRQVLALPAVQSALL